MLSRCFILTRKVDLYCLFDYLCFMHSEVSIIFVVCGLSALILCFWCWDLVAVLSQVVHLWVTAPFKNGHNFDKYQFSLGKREIPVYCRLIFCCTAVISEKVRGKSCNSLTAAGGPMLPSFPSMPRSAAVICSRLLISCIFNWAVYLTRKSIEVLAAVWSLSKALQLP